MLQCFSFHQSQVHSHAISHNLPEKTGREESSLPASSPHFLKSKNLNTYSRLNKYTVQVNDKKREPYNKDCVRFILNAVEDICESSEELWAVESQPSQSSVNSSTSFTNGSIDTESTHSVCEDQTTSEDGSPERQLLNTPSSRSQVLLKDPMLRALPTAWRKHFTVKLPKTPVQPLPLFQPETESLPLISPSQGLNRSLFPEGQGALESLFEDVWVTPESTTLKCSSWPESVTDDSDADGNVQINWKKVKESKEGIKHSTPKDLRKVRSKGRGSKRGRVVAQAKPKRKCVNGFLMFCRVNRRLYIRLYPGIPSTTVTKELANLWHTLPKREKRLYCLKACSFSRKQNRNVRVEVHEAETKADSSTLSPLHMLLAYRDRHATAK